MKNADLPVAPAYSPEGEILDEKELHEMKLNFSCSFGLTKREYFAGLAMQGLSGDTDSCDYSKAIAGIAVSHADALLAELERTK